MSNDVPQQRTGWQAGVGSAEGDGLVVRTASLGGSALSQALQTAGPSSSDVRGWLNARPNSLDDWHARAVTIRDSHTTPDWFRMLAPAFAATGRAAARLARAAANGVVVTTGQQPGLFGGPTYTWTKAISALSLADTLEAETGVAVAPVFWAATDDSDWEEASVTYVLTMRGLQILRPASARTDGIAMMDVPLGDVTEALAALRGASGSAPHQHMLDEVASAYVPHATVGAAYLQLLRALLEPLGIAVLDASHPALRAAADPFLRRALGKSAAIAEQLKERTASIRAAGFEPQVETMDALSLVFQSRIGSTGRQQERIRERVSVADAARVAREAEVGTLGPNVLLRPVLERHLLPTMAYVAGPGEYAYFAQVAPVANAIGASQPLALPRWAGEVIETRSNRLRERLGISEADLRDPHAVETELARAALPEDAQDALERLRVTLETQTMALRAAVAADDGLVHPAVVDGLHRDFTHRLERFERRVVGGVKRREDTLMREIAHVRAAFQPLGTSPERVLNLMPVLARHGNAVFDLMQTAARPYSESIVHGLPHVPSSTG